MSEQTTPSTAPLTPASSAVIVTPEQLLAHWQGHRNLTRRIIDKFPEQELFEYSIGGMRPFATLAMEFVGMAVPSLQGVVTREWPKWSPPAMPKTKADLLRVWDETTAEIDRLWAQIPPGRWQEDDVAFGMWPGKIWWLMFYVIDNEIHHRGQGYVYLRSLGIEPPPFFER